MSTLHSPEFTQSMILKNRGYDDGIPYNEDFHILQTLRNWTNIRAVFPGLSFSQMELVADLIMETELGSYKGFFDNFKPSIYNVLVVFLKLADLGHFLEDDFRLHLYWVFRVHHELGTFRTNTDWNISTIAKDTLFFGKTFVEPTLKIATEQFLEAKFAQKITDNYLSNMSKWGAYIVAE